jgi:hypothetical protein
MRADGRIVVCGVGLMCFLLGTHMMTSFQQGASVESRALGQDTLPVVTMPRIMGASSIQSKFSKELEFEHMNKGLIGPADVAEFCGEMKNPRDCDPWYTVARIQESVQYMDDNSEVIIPYTEEKLARRAREVAAQCKMIDDRGTLNGGGVGVCMRSQPVTT